MAPIPNSRSRCLLLIALSCAQVTVAADANPPAASVFDLPRLQAQREAIRRSVATHFAAGRYAAAEALLLEASKRFPRDVGIQYNLACAQARLGQAALALASLDRAVTLGFRDRNHIEKDEDLRPLRENAGFQAITKKADEPAPKRPVRTVKLADVKDAETVVDGENVAWDARLGIFRVLLPTDGKATADEPITQGITEEAQLLRRWHQEGSAAGNHGDYYDNHDSDHSNLNVSRYPQLTRIEFAEAIRKRNFHHGVQLRFLYSAVVLGNSSTALTQGPAWRSQARHALTLPRGPALLYLQYRANHLYIYPEHRDHDPGRNGGDGQGHGDVFPAMTPYMIISQGSSGSDRPFLQAVAATLAAFRPDVKQELRRTGMLMPTVQMILRRSQRPVARDKDYLTAKAHPTVFDKKHLDVVRMVHLAHKLTRQTLPPLARIQVEQETEGTVGRDYFDLGPRERLFDTPCAVARVVKSTAYRRRLVVSAESSTDPDNKPLKHRWVILRGDADRITIRPLNATASRVEIQVPYHVRRPVTPGSTLESNRVDIAVFADNGVTYSPPAFVSLLYLDHEKREYDEKHRIRLVDYTDPAVRGNYVDPRLDLPRDWRDEYHYAEDGSLAGWTRIRGDNREQFTADGQLIVKRDESGKVIQSVPVRYMAGRRPGGAIFLDQVAELPKP